MTPLEDRTIGELRRLAARKTIDEDGDSSVYDRVGSNVDDAYELGVADGETLGARAILRAMKLEQPS